MTINPQEADQFKDLIVAYTMRDTPALEDRLNDLMPGPLEAHRIIVALALLAGKPLLQRTGTGADPWVVQTPDVAPSPGSPEFLCARLVAGGANDDDQAISKAAALAVKLGPDTAVDVVLHLLRMVDIQGRRGDYNNIDWTPKP